MPPINLSHLPLQALRCFEAAARHQSFRLAAEELCLTPSAVSHQIKRLEDWLGNPLFLRKTRQIELTEIGRNLFDEVSEAFRRMETSLHHAALLGKRQTVRLALPDVMQHVLQKDFIDAFRNRYPQYDLELITIPNAMYVPHLEILQRTDVALLLGSGFWEKARVTPLISLHLTAFCPSTLARHKFPLQDPRQLEEYPWLNNKEFPESWGWFLSFLGLSGLYSKVGTDSYENLAALRNPALADAGIALMDIHITPYLLGARWHRMLDIAVSSIAYCLVCPEEGGGKPGTDTLIKFFTEQAQRLGWPAKF